MKERPILYSAPMVRATFEKNRNHEFFAKPTVGREPRK